MSTVENFVQAFKENSVKITPQRLAIFNVLEGNTNHPSAEDIYIEIIKIYPTTSFATVYNTLERLHKLKLLLELSIEKGKKHYDPNTNQHHHLQCSNCKKIVDIFEDYDVQLPGHIENDYEIDGYQISFYGRCKSCN
ncbi:MAG: ferric uptake regulator [uncultured bacterium]|nr:MAG: ferric uptake regulator [uncultured bacterium]HBH18654.1 transcriptional repressor [Cyanobacteria bacterium UBA9579]